MYLGMRFANLLFSRARLFHGAQWLGRIALKPFTRKDGWIHALPSVGAQWTQTRDLRGLPKQTFHEWWAGRNVQQVSRPAVSAASRPPGREDR
jgi:L-lactate dehydrogenase complex protein LldF